MFLLLLLVLLRLATGTSSICTDVSRPPCIIVPPKNETAFLNPVKNITLTCNGRGTLLYWIVNGTNLNDLDNPDLVSDHTQYGVELNLCSLDIRAKAKYNGTAVQCVAIDSNGVQNKSQNATVLIQGMLAPVGNVKVDCEPTFILLSWTPPFSLNVTGVDPDIWYTVRISNVTDENNPTTVSCTDCHNLTQPHYNFTAAYPSPEQKYSFTVIPVNKVGNGRESKPVTGRFTNGSSDGGVSCILIIMLSIASYIYIS